MNEHARYLVFFLLLVDLRLIICLFVVGENKTTTKKNNRERSNHISHKTIMTSHHHESGVAIIGSSNMDLVHSVDSLPKAGETIFASAYNEHLGGKGNNQAIMVAKLTQSSSAEHPKCIFITGIGNDGFATTLQQSFSRHLNNTETIVPFDDTTTGRAIINVDKNGRNNIVLLKGANARLTEAHVDQFWPLIQQNCKVLVLQNEIPLETTCYALQKGSQNGLLTIFNPAPAPSHDSLPLLDEKTLGSINVICLNETEAMTFIGEEESGQWANKDELTVEDGLQIAKKLYDNLVQKCSACKSKLQVLITMGGNGSVAYYDPEFCVSSAHNSENRVLEHFPIEKVENVVDTTGAGDAFVGSLAYFLSCDISLNNAIPLAASVASQTVLHHGAQSSYEFIDRTKLNF